MLIFCEDCGKKHAIEIDQENPASFKFRCDECGFLIPVSPPAPASATSKADKDLVPDLLLIPSHERIDFGVVQGSEEKVKLSLVAAADGRKINLQGMANRSLLSNVTVTRLSRMSFMVTVVDPGDTAAEPLASYDGTGLELVDTISGAKVTVDIAFVRSEPRLILESNRVDLGQVAAGSQADGSFLLQIVAMVPWKFVLLPDPEYFTISTYFCITSPEHYSLAPQQRQEISFFVKVDPEVQADEEFAQPVLIMSNDPHGDKVGRVMITAHIRKLDRPAVL